MKKDLEIFFPFFFLPSVSPNTAPSGVGVVDTLRGGGDLINLRLAMRVAEDVEVGE